MNAGQPHVVLFSTDGALDVLQDWCEGACGGTWSLTIEDLDVQTRKKALRLEFERADDKAAFIARFGQSREAVTRQTAARR